jgi:hypothetical protein
MKTLAKIIMRLIFGHPLSEIEARQKRENEKAVKAILAEEDTRTKQAWDIIHKHARYYIGRMKVYQYGRPYPIIDSANVK